jgi:hypothetical protein
MPADRGRAGERQHQKLCVERSFKKMVRHQVGRAGSAQMRDLIMRGPIGPCLRSRGRPEDAAAMTAAPTKATAFPG